MATQKELFAFLGLSSDAKPKELRDKLENDLFALKQKMLMKEQIPQSILSELKRLKYYLLAEDQELKLIFKQDLRLEEDSLSFLQQYEKDYTSVKMNVMNAQTWMEMLDSLLSYYEVEKYYLNNWKKHFFKFQTNEFNGKFHEKINTGKIIIALKNNFNQFDDQTLSLIKEENSRVEKLLDLLKD